MPEVYDRAEQSDNRNLLQMALSKLTAKERAAILLFEVAGFSIEEITVIQNEKSRSAVKSRLSRTRTKLKKYITDLESNRNIKINSSEENFMNSKFQNGSGDDSFSGDIVHETLRLAAEANRKD